MFLKSTGAGPCPFCQGDPKPKLRRLGSTNAASFAVVCSGCRATGPLSPAPVVAIDAWNEGRPAATMHPQTPPDSPQIHCKLCERQYPIAMWATRTTSGYLERRCPNRSCQEWVEARTL